tara:strand:+ start:948 stop:1268 length:321 start_codon:yes stop_codon:yes gene_type:complete
MKKVIKDFKNLCTPAYLYLVISVVAMITMMFQNAGNTNTYCVGDYECPVPNTGLVFFSKGVYILFWTFILNAMCKAGYKNFSWFLVLIPFILMAILIGLLMLNGGI